MGVGVFLVEKTRENGVDCLGVAVDCVIETVVRRDGGAEREVMKIAPVAVVIEVGVVAADGLIVHQRVLSRLFEVGLEDGVGVWLCGGIG